MEGQDIQNIINITNYKETGYEDASFEIVGAPPSEEVFVPMQLSVMERNQPLTDEMFYDFGGNREESGQIWHLPQDVKFVAEDKKKSEEEEKLRHEEELQNALDEQFNQGLLAGKQESYEAAKQEYNLKLQEIEAHFTGVIEDLARQLKEKVQDIEKEAIKLSMHLTEKIIPYAVEINPEYLLPVIQEALGLCGGAIIKQIRVSPEDLEFINVVGLSKNLKEFDGSWQFVGDETIRAGCVVDTSAGEVEYDLNKAWDRTKKSIVSVLK